VCGFSYTHILFFPKHGNRFSVLSIDEILKISKNKITQKSDVLKKRKKVNACISPPADDRHARLAAGPGTYVVLSFCLLLFAVSGHEDQFSESH
jgi:alkyl hydroperoxide reductase subunit AhpF